MIFKSFSAIEAINKSKIVKVIEDKKGFIWFASESDVYRFDAYDVIDINDLVKSPQVSLRNIKDIAIDADNLLWVLTDQVLLNFNHEEIREVSWYQEELQAEKIIILPDQTLLITPQSVVSIFENNLTTTEFPSDYSVPFMIKNHHWDVSTNRLFITTKRALFIYDTYNNSIVQERFDPDSNPFLWDVHIDKQNNTWLSTDKGVYKKVLNSKRWHHFQHNGFPSTIKSIESDNRYIWFASALYGLYGLDVSTGEWFSNKNSEHNYSIKTNNLSNLFLDSNELLWVTTFEGDILVTDPMYPSLELKSQCIENKAIYQVSALDQTIFMAAEDGVVIKTLDQCDFIPTFQSTGGQNTGFTPTSLLVESKHKVWLGSTQGMHSLNTQNSAVSNYYINNEIDYVRFISRINSEELIFGSGMQLYILNVKRKTTRALDFDDFSGLRFYDALRHQNKLYLATNKGLFELTKDFQLIAIKDRHNLLSTLSLSTIDSIDGSLILGGHYDGLYYFSLKDGLLERIDSPVDGFVNITNIIHSDSYAFWFTSNAGLSRYDLNLNSHITLNEHRGLTSRNFIKNSAHQYNSQLYFGTRSGVIGLNPKSIPNKHQNNQLVFTGLKSFNSQIFVDSEGGSILKKPLDITDKLILKHSDLSISIGFSSLNFIDPYENEYYYKLEGFDPIWTKVDADNRQATYTKLPKGNYEFKLKSILGKDTGAHEIKSINIQVLPPPWLTWWAITTYVLLLLGLIYWYIQRKIATNKKVAAMLRIEVTEKTKELNIQKQKVESLLAKKNELFSNVSHEFRTPLTLIIGPINQLMNKQVDADDINSLKMVNRNASRLLSLVEQLLQIARVSDFENIQTSTLKTQKQVSSLVESFQHMALSKKLKLQLLVNDQAIIKVTDQFVDTVLGNLLSNAIKYTQPGGTVSVSARNNSRSLILSVKDSGAGLTESQQLDIFKRFKRLESHQAIEGIGIGLSVVEEVVKINEGSIKVSSELGIGSEFIVSVRLADAINATEEHSISTLVQQLQAESTERTSPVKNYDNDTEDNTMDTVLVIEDNLDMREHIVSIIKPHYNYITAVNGLKGVATAIEQIPDIIISDVMMPEMDGFKVARIIRSDQRTSHIPLMLLTALHDKTNRIKGWRENVDAYMTKPFDRDELLVQLESMLTIRDILKKKAGKELNKSNDKISTLTKKDQDFVDKLNAVIEENYQNPVLNRIKIASLMAVSDRQLQRKLKALIDQNPMDILREYRLNKAKVLLNDGYQISQIADDCGFNSLSYFSQCFKAQFGLSPKKYQQTI